MLTILIKAEAASKERHLDLSMPAIMVEEHLRQFFRMIEESEMFPEMFLTMLMRLTNITRL